MGKSKNKKKAVIRPWCWYCEREFEDEKVLMQHQKAKHFKCGMCPRRLNTAGGLAVHIQQVHKLDGDALPRIDNALPGRDGYEVEIFGMEGIPAPDVADYKRRKEIELGLAAGSISQPQQKRQKIDNRVLTEEELRVQLAAHKALMGQADAAPVDPAVSAAVYNAAPETYSAPPEMAMPPSMPPFGGFPPGMAGAPPFPPAGMPMPGGPPFPPPPPGMMPGMPPFMPGGAPPFPSTSFGGSGIAPGLPPYNPGAMPPASLNMSISSAVVGGPPPPSFIPSSATSLGFALPPGAGSGGPGLDSSESAPAILVKPQPLTLPPGAKEQILPEFKKPTSLKYTNPNFSPDEVRAQHSKYLYYSSSADGPRGQKRPRAEDLI